MYLKITKIRIIEQMPLWNIIYLRNKRGHGGEYTMLDESSCTLYIKAPAYGCVVFEELCLDNSFVRCGHCSSLCVYTSKQSYILRTSYTRRAHVI